MIIELDQIENESQELGSRYIPSDYTQKKKTFEEIVEEIMEYDILLSSEVGKKVLEFESVILEDAQITLKVMLIVQFI